MFGLTTEKSRLRNIIFNKQIQQELNLYLVQRHKSHAESGVSTIRNEERKEKTKKKNIKLLINKNIETNENN